MLVKDTFARVIVISPVWLYGSQTSLIISGVLFAILAWADSGRAPRSSYSVIIRNAILFSGLAWSWLLLFIGWPFWFLLSHATVWLFLFWAMVTTTFAHHFIYPLVQHDYHEVLKTGWHPFWDTSMFNFDSELIKDGGFEEPEYKNFVPPAWWTNQCPVCGARQQTHFGVCWNPGCNYGADGDDTAYYERWGQ